METYLYADTYHNEFVVMDGYSTVPYWQTQGEGVDDFDIRSIYGMGTKVVLVKEINNVYASEGEKV